MLGTHQSIVGTNNMKLTKKSMIELYDYHGGRGKCFYSCGTSDEIVSLDFGFIERNGKTILSLGDRNIVLTKEQTKIVGAYAVEDNI